MGFIDSYKQLEKLCGEVLNDDRRVSAYIDEMLSTPRGSYYVRTWDEDLRKLKHYRWVRNKIVHEPDCTEKNMCEPGDEKWLEDFYSRIMKQSDPLALYHKAIRTRSASKSTQKSSASKRTSYKKRKRKSTHRKIGCAVFMIIALIIAAIFIIKYNQIFKF